MTQKLSLEIHQGVRGGVGAGAESRLDSRLSAHLSALNSPLGRNPGDPNEIPDCVSEAQAKRVSHSSPQKQEQSQQNGREGRCL